MARVITYKCDFPNCDKVRGEANHWFAVFTATSGIAISPFNPNNVKEHEEIFCGEAHLLAYISRKIKEFNPSPAPLTETVKDLLCKNCNLEIYFSSTEKVWLHKPSYNICEYITCDYATNHDPKHREGSATPPSGTPEIQA
jgi:ssDNA-binding Zn-finger/Zn-ribbon topoisomerase 1